MGVLKMLNELSILCGVEVGAVLYSSFEAGPVVWPSVEGTQLLNLKTVNRVTEMALVMFQMLQGHQLNISLSSEDLNDLGWAINIYLAEIEKKVEAIMKNSSIPASSPTQGGPTTSANP
nr:agamous-like MADS-box protein AGL80 [Ipomoea batatas]